MLPEKTLNVYPKSKENLEALVTFYFNHNVNQRGKALELMQESNLTLNQFEFIVKNLSDAYISIFRQRLKGDISLYNLIQYGIDALENETPNPNGSKNRQLITKEFRNFVIEKNYINMVMSNEIYLPKLLRDINEIERKKFANTPFVCHHTPEDSGSYFQYLVVDLRLGGYDYLVARFRVLDDAIAYAQSIK